MPKRIMEGVVVSTKQDKTVVVRRTKKYHAHDEGNVAELGKTVSIVECAPRSKLKRWELMTSTPGAEADT